MGVNPSQMRATSGERKIAPSTAVKTACPLALKLGDVHLVYSNFSGLFEFQSTNFGRDIAFVPPQKRRY
jgi:hypothetical protein